MIIETEHYQLFFYKREDHNLCQKYMSSLKEHAKTENMQN